MADILLKQWVQEEAARRGLSTRTVYRQLRQPARYGWLRLRRVNARVIYVLPGPRPPEGVPLGEWVRREAARLGLKPGTLYARLARSGYAGLELRRVSSKVVRVLGQPEARTHA